METRSASSWSVTSLMSYYSRSESNSHLTSQGIPPLLWNPKFHYRVHKTPPLVPVLSQMYPVHTFPLYFPKIRFNIVFPSTPRSSKWSVYFTLSNRNLGCIFRSHRPCKNYEAPHYASLFNYMLLPPSVFFLFDRLAVSMKHRHLVPEMHREASLCDIHCSFT
jgi:hypothetical protein